MLYVGKPTILFGQGGIAVEVLHDHAVALPPLNSVLARDMIKARPAFMKEAGYRDFLKTHGHLMAR